MVTLAPVDGEVGEAGQVDGGEGGDGAVGAVEDVQALQAGTTAREPGWCGWWLSCWTSIAGAGTIDDACVAGGGTIAGSVGGMSSGGVRTCPGRGSRCR